MTSDLLSLVDYAVAPDGGSMVLFFTSGLCLRLDNDIDSTTRGRLYLDKKTESQLLSPADELAYLAILENAHIDAELDKDEAKEFIASFCSKIKG